MGMGLRAIRTGAAMLGAALACAAPAAAVETGVNETQGQRLLTAETAAGLGAGWVRLWSSWESMQPAPGKDATDVIANLDGAVRAAEAKGLAVLVVVQRSPAWASGGRGGIAPPSNPATFGAFMGHLAQRVPGVDAWEIWNEPDDPGFFLGGPDPGRYAAMLRAAYPAIKAAQPADVVVSGGMVANDMDFLAGLYAHGVQGSFDAVAVHTDTACLTSPPDFVYRDERGRIGRYVFTGYREVHEVMARNGDGAKPIWMTEIGWSSASTKPRSCHVGARAGTKPVGVTQRQQAAFLTAAYRCAASDPYVQAVFWFGLQDIPGTSAAPGYGLYRRSGSAKPAAAAFRALRGGIAPARCGGAIDHTPPALTIANPVDGLRFADKLAVSARAADEPGGTGLRRIHLWADGRRVASWGKGKARIYPWSETRNWRLGRHTLRFEVRDRAHNVTARTVTVEKVRPGRLARVATSCRLALVRVRGLTTRVAGRLVRPAGSLLPAPGHVRVIYQRWTGRRWSTERRVTRFALHRVRLTQRVPRAGRWRVFLAYPGAAPYARSRSTPVGFRASL
jgi:hypothetical protein